MQDINSAIRVLEKQLDQLRLARDIMQVTNGKVYRTPAPERPPKARPIMHDRDTNPGRIIKPGRLSLEQIKPIIMQLDGEFTVRDVMNAVMAVHPNTTMRTTHFASMCHYLNNKHHPPLLAVVNEKRRGGGLKSYRVIQQPQAEAMEEV